MNEFSMIDYEKLVQDYETGLTTTLRGFRPGLEFIDSWVPDEDVAKSILNLIEAASMAGESGIRPLRLFLNSKTAPQLDASHLQVLAANLARIEPNQNKDGSVLLTILPCEATQVAPSYQKAVEVYSKKNIHEGTGSDYSCTLVPHVRAFTVESGEITLTAFIDILTHSIQKVFYRGRLTPAQKAVFEGICEILPGCTVQEASDHGVISLEHRFRDLSLPRANPGIVTSSNADPMFQQLLNFLRTLRKIYDQEIHPETTLNFYEPPISEYWKNLSAGERALEIRKVIQEIGAEVPISNSEVEIRRIDHDVRIFMTYVAELPSGEKGRRLMCLERGLKNRLEQKLQIYQEEVKDLNSKRRL